MTARERDRSWATSGIGPDAFAALAERVPASELWSLLLEVLARRAAARTPGDLLQQWERDRFTECARVDQRTIVALDSHLLAAAHGFEAVELSPLAPLGACSVVGLASQNKIVSALRGTEVVADPTNVLALECARRLRKDPGQTVRLATCHRCVRAQEVPKQPGFTQHFRIFCLGSAAREGPDHATTGDSIIEHITTHLSALDRLEQHGYHFPGRHVVLLATDERAPLADRIAAALSGVSTERQVLTHKYYDGLRFMIHVRSPAGDAIPFIDGGAFDWVARLGSNKRFVFVASGMGSQLATVLFRKSSS